MEHILMTAILILKAIFTLLGIVLTIGLLCLLYRDLFRGWGE